MKKSILLSATILISLLSYSQTIQSRLFVVNKAGVGEVAYLKNDSTLVVIDSLATIKVCIEQIKRQNQQIMEVTNKYVLARKILSYIDLSKAVVRDKAKFNAAILKHHELTKNERE